MSKLFLLFSLLSVLILSNNNILADDKGNQIQKRSIPYSSYPQPFVNPMQGNNPHNAPAVSTGYYFVDDEDPMDVFWKPNVQFQDTNDEPELWTRVVSGPRQKDKSFWTSKSNKNGMYFFRNPSLPGAGKDMFEHGSINGTDSTDNAIAGPIPINLAKSFYFNGIRYDSFYVSTNGIVALTNRRYFYDTNGNRYIPAGMTSAYDPNSMDYYAKNIIAYNGGVEYRTKLFYQESLKDTTKDDFGYKYAVLGGQFALNTSSIPSNTGGIRQNGGALNSFNPDYKGAYISPFFGSLNLSQYITVTRLLDDWGKVYFKRTLKQDKLFIYFVNAQLVGEVSSHFGIYKSLRKDIRPSDGPYVDGSAQVVLDCIDSSVTIIYEKFTGNVNYGGYNTAFAPEVFRYNTSAGVRGFARHTNNNRNSSNNEEFEQYTHYFNKDEIQNANYPNNSLRVRFKQWMNSLAVIDIQYRVRKQDKNANLDFQELVNSSKVNNYEILAGNERLGAIQPVGIIQNLSNDIQGIYGVNYVEQDLKFQAKFRIENLASKRIIYNRSVKINDDCLNLNGNLDLNKNCGDDPNNKVQLVSLKYLNGDYTSTVENYPQINSWNSKKQNGVPAYSFVQILFPPWEANEIEKDPNGKLLNIGRMRAYFVADPTDPIKGNYGDKWPHDDTTSVNLFIMKRLNSFSDDVTEWHYIENTKMPSVLKWVNMEGAVVNGESVSRYPLAPRRLFGAENQIKNITNSPVILLDRKQRNGLNHPNLPNGDQIRSFPIDMEGKCGSVISISVQRTQNINDWERGFGDGVLVGPEPRAILNSNIYNRYLNKDAVSYNFDELLLEIAAPSSDGLKNITNIPNENWRKHPRRGNATTETNVSALHVFGAGGYRVGFLETDKDSALALENETLGQINSLRANPFDDGIDFEFQKFFVSIPDTFIGCTEYSNVNHNFRFRVRVSANDDNKCAQCIGDDNDEFFVDNIRLLPSKGDITDLEVSSSKIIWPYTTTIASQATNIPIIVKISNNTAIPAQNYEVKTRIFKDYQGYGESKDLDAGIKPVYSKNEVVPYHPGSIERVISMPGFNARLFGPGKYRMVTNLIQLAVDLEVKNDTNYTDFEIKFGDDFAYDPADKGINESTNDVPNFTLIPGRGLTLEGYSFGGDVDPNLYKTIPYGVGYVGGSISGQFAMKFELQNTDTIYGYKAIFGSQCSYPGTIFFSISSGNDNLPNTIIASTKIERNAMKDDVTGDLIAENKTFCNYRLSKGVVLPAGTYWMHIVQNGQDGINIGASKSRMGMRTMDVSIPNGAPIGSSGLSLMVHKEFRKTDLQGKSTTNNNNFAYENDYGSNTWKEFSPNYALPAYAHLHHFGSGIDIQTQTLTRGTWIPEIRPFFGLKSYGKVYTHIDCNNSKLELTNFDANISRSAIDLFWETASEINNEGFTIEKRILQDENQDMESNWNQLDAFIKGAGNSSTKKYYNFRDEDVVTNTTYQYRLSQIDKDGVVNCNKSSIVTKTYSSDNKELNIQNKPNPANEYITFEFSINNEKEISIEILDLLGKTVKTIKVQNLIANSLNKYTWDLSSETGEKLQSGTYIYRIISNDNSSSQKLNIIR